jgi:hypothetical protein
MTVTQERHVPWGRSWLCDRVIECAQGSKDDAEVALAEEKRSPPGLICAPEKSPVLRRWLGTVRQLLIAVAAAIGGNMRIWRRVPGGIWRFAMPLNGGHRGLDVGLAAC